MSEPFSKPRVRLFGDTGQAQQYIGAGYNLLFRVERYMQAAGIPVFSTQESLPDGAVVRVMVAGNERIVECTPPQVVGEEGQEAPARVTDGDARGLIFYPSTDEFPDGVTEIDGAEVDPQAFLSLLPPHRTPFRTASNVRYEGGQCVWRPERDPVITWKPYTVSIAENRLDRYEPDGEYLGDVFILGVRIVVPEHPTDPRRRCVHGVTEVGGYLIVITDDPSTPVFPWGGYSLSTPFNVLVWKTPSPRARLRRMVRDNLLLPRVITPVWELADTLTLPFAGTVVNTSMYYWCGPQVFFSPDGSTATLPLIAGGYVERQGFFPASFNWTAKQILTLSIDDEGGLVTQRTGIFDLRSYQMLPAAQAQSGTVTLQVLPQQSFDVEYRYERFSSTNLDCYVYRNGEQRFYGTRRGAVFRGFYVHAFDALSDVWLAMEYHREGQSFEPAYARMVVQRGTERLYEGEFQEVQNLPTSENVAPITVAGFYVTRNIDGQIRVPYAAARPTATAIDHYNWAVAYWSEDTSGDKDALGVTQMAYYKAEEFDLREQFPVEGEEYRVGPVGQL